MTTQESLLALAKAVYPTKAVTDDKFGLRVWHGGLSGSAPVEFCPAHNSEQAMEVLCWLIRAANCNAFRFGSVDIRQTAIVIGISMTGDESRASYFDHDNTPASLRSAIVQAACRVSVLPPLNP